MLTTLLIGLAGVAVGATLTARINQNTLESYENALDDAQCEIATLRKQIKAQAKIHAQFEKRLIAQFGQPNTLPMVYEEDDDTSEEKPRQTWSIGNAVYFSHDAYLEAMEAGELQQQGGRLI